MRAILTTLLISLALPGAAQDSAAAGAPTEAATTEAGFAPEPVGDRRLEDFRWSNRLVVVFADTPLDPAFTRQIELLAARPEVLAERDVIVLTDTDPAARSPIRTALRPRGFSMVIVDKDSSVMLRKPSPWDVREINRTIDKTPLRQQEMREQREVPRP